MVSVLDNLEVMKKGGEKKVQLTGTFGTSPAVLDMEKGRGILKRLIPSPKADYQWTKYYFTGYFGIPEIVAAPKKTDLTAMDLPVLADTVFCTVSGNEEYLLIDIKEQKISDPM